MKSAHLLMTETDGTEIYAVEDPSGDTETFERYNLLATRNGRPCWTEGIRKDRAAMREPLRSAVETFLKGGK